MSDPPLVLGAELMLPVNTTHPENDSRQTERARVIQDVLIGRALGTSVGTVEIEPLVFADPAGANFFVHRLVPFAIKPKVDVVETAINFICGSENDRRRIAQFTEDFEQIQRAARIDIKVINRCSEAARDGNLRSKVKDGCGLFDAPGQSADVASV